MISPKDIIPVVSLCAVALGGIGLVGWFWPRGPQELEA